MQATEPTPSMSSRLPRVVSTNADTESPITRHSITDEATRNRWQHVIDFSLIEWECDPSQLDDEGIQPPSRKVIGLAIALAESFRDRGFPAPNSVVPDPNGGIVFERRENGSSEVFHVWDDGSVEYQRFQGTRLIERGTLQFEPTASLTR